MREQGFSYASHAAQCSRRFGVLLVGVCPTHAETDVLMRAVGFALTGSDDAEPKTIDKSKCVFAIGKEPFTSTTFTPTG
jgi:hypothetical protein